MNSQRYSKFLSSFITSLMITSLFIDPVLAVALNNRADEVNRNPSSLNLSIAVNDALPLASEFTQQTLMAAGDTIRVSVDSSGLQANNYSQEPSISADGRYVAFISYASNLVGGDTNGYPDIFVHDRQGGEMTRVSVASDGAQGNDFSNNYPSISADGRYVAFASKASNLVSEDTNWADDIFVHDRQSGQTKRVSVASNGAQGNGTSRGSSISADGRYVAFFSDASNLVSGDTNSKIDIFVHDRQSGQTTRVSVASDGSQGNDHSSFLSISSDGRFVAFYSDASNLVPGDTNATDCFVHDRLSGQTTRVSVASDGTQANGTVYQSSPPSISSDGRFVVFPSSATNLVSGDTNGSWDVFVHDRQSSQTTRISVASNGMQGNNNSSNPSISSNGRYVTFVSLASNLVSEIDSNSESDVYFHDRQNGQTTRISAASNGVQGNDRSDFSSISSDGRYVTFFSLATNLVNGDTNEIGDIFVHENNLSVITPWTIMVYLDGDNSGSNSLDDNYLNVFNQLEHTANNSNINIVVAWDRLGSNNSAYYQVQYNTDLNQLAMYTEGVDRWSKGELDMGNPASLSDFIQWARTNYPAQNYALLISDHGTGLNGTALDSTSGGDWLTINELGSALSTATANGSNKLDVVFADSCLMGMIEDGYQIRNYANIYIASENLIWIPAIGSQPYSNYFADITSSTTPQELATDIVNDYASWLDGTYPGQYGYTLSAADLTKIDSLVAAISNLSAALQPQLSTYANEVRDARNAAQKFDSDGSKSINSPDEYIDLSDLASELKQRIADTTVQNASQGVIDAINAYVIENTSKSGSEVFSMPNLDPNRVHGVSIFFPTGDSKRSFYSGLNLDFASDTIWRPQRPNLALSDAGTIGWGPLLVDYISTITPSAPDDPNPPDLTSAPPVIPIVTSISLANPNPTSDTSVGFTVTFSEPVINVDVADFTLTKTGTILGESLDNVSGGPTIYTVTVSTGTGSGDLRLDIISSPSIQDLSGNELAGPYTGGEMYTVIKSLAPTDILLSNNTVIENQPLETIVGTLTTTDPDAGDTHTYSFACAVPGVDDTSFQIGGTSGDELQTAAVFDFEKKNAYNICIRTDDGHGGTFDKNFTINVLNVNETLTLTYRSVGAYDGWILESGENTTLGGTLDSTATTFNLGDGAADKQYRAILHFDTSSLPDNAIITKVTLKIRKQAFVGTDPFAILGGLKVDMRKPSFGSIGLTVSDFQTAAGRVGVATFGATPVSNWYSAVLSGVGRNYINKAGTTQFRLYFATDDNNDNSADFMRFFSGNHATASVRPTLIIEYRLP